MSTTSTTEPLVISGPVTILPPLEVPCGVCAGTGNCPECDPDDPEGSCSMCHGLYECPECGGIGLEEQSA